MDIRAVTDIGTRQENQDSFWTARFIVDKPWSPSVNDVDPDGELPEGVSVGSIVCLCDGMGGLEEGAYASRTTLEYIRDCIRSGKFDVDSVKEAIYEANREIYTKGGKGRIGTTCTLIILVDGEYRILHAGDSRCYKVSKDYTYKLLTKDHTGFNKYIERGELVREGSRFLLDGNIITDRHARSLRSKLTRCVGSKESVTLDEEEGYYRDGDIFLIASDGFWHRLGADYNWPKKFVQNFSHGERYFQNLINGYKNAGEKDNLTVAAVRTLGKKTR